MSRYLAVRFSSDQTSRMRASLNMSPKMRESMMVEAMVCLSLVGSGEGFSRGPGPGCVVPAAQPDGRPCARRAGRRPAMRHRRRARAAPSPGPRRWAAAPRGSARPGWGGCTAWRRSPAAARAPGRRAGAPRSSSCGVTPATGAGRPGDARGERDAAGRIGQTRCVGRDVDVEIEREIERAEDQARSAGGGHCVHLATPRALSIRRARCALGSAAFARGNLLRRLGLGQQDAGCAGIVAAPAGRPRTMPTRRR